MPKPTAPQLAILENLEYDVERYLSVNPRTAVFQAQINGQPPTDSSSGVYYQVTFDNVTLGAYTDVRAGMTVDFGTTAGARDIGSVRVRKAPTSSILYIAATAPGKLDLYDNVYLTVRDEYLIWNRQWRLTASASGTSYNNTFTQYKDFDEVYSDQNEDMLPIANIVHAVDANGDWLPVCMAGFNDPGEDYRTVQLTAVGVAMAAGATISGVEWDIADGTLVDGYELTDTTILVTFPKSTPHRHIHLEVTDTNGKVGWKPLGIYVADRDNPPLSNFRVERDERFEGRDLTLVFFGNEDEADEVDVPRQTECIYWEVATFGDDEAPDCYLGQTRGWAVRETTLYKPDADEWTLELGGGATWLRNWGGPSDKITNGTGRWNLMPNITIDRLIAYDLGQHSTFLQICNFRPSGITNATREETIDEGKLWDQLVSLGKRITADPYCDELGGLRIKPHISYMSSGDRAAVPVAASLTPDHWPYESGLSLLNELLERVGLTEVGGKNWNGSTEGKWLARGPGRTGSGVGGRQDYDTGVILPTTSPLARLMEIAGHHWARLNNPRPEVTLVRLGNADHMRPGDLVSITYEDDSLTGATLSNVLFIVKRISVAHSQEPGAQEKVITYTLEQVTRGNPGQEQPIAQSTTPGLGTIYTPPSLSFPGLYVPQLTPSQLYGIPRGTVTLAAFTTANELLRTGPNINGSGFDIRSSMSGPRWHVLNLTTLTNWGGGNVLMFIVDAQSYKSSTVDGWIVTTTQFQKISNIFGSPTLSAAVALGGTTDDRRMQFERGIPNFGVITSYRYGVGIDVHRTLDGLTLTKTNTFANWDLGAGISHSTGVAVSPHQNRTIISLFVNSASIGSQLTDGRVSTDSAMTFGDLSNPNITSTGNAGMAFEIHVPFEDDSTAYFGHVTHDGGLRRLLRLYKVVGAGAQADVSPVVSGIKYGPEFQFSVKTCDIDKNRVLLFGHRNNAQSDDRYGVFLSRNGAQTWETLVQPDVLSTVKLTAGNISGDDPDVLYGWGINGEIAVSEDGGPFDSRKGDYTGSGRIVNICGGGNAA
jgi:hypothetical protein